MCVVTLVVLVFVGKLLGCALESTAVVKLVPVVEDFLLSIRFRFLRSGRNIPNAVRKSALRHSCEFRKEARTV